MNLKCSLSSKRRVKNSSKRLLKRQKPNSEKLKTFGKSRKENFFSRNRLRRKKRSFVLRANTRNLRLRLAVGVVELSNSQL